MLSENKFSSKYHPTVAIADLTISEDLSFNIDQKPSLNNVLELEQNLSKYYNNPNSNLVSKDLLYVIHDHNTKRNLAMIEKEYIFKTIISWIWCYNL